MKTLCLCLFLFFSAGCTSALKRPGWVDEPASVKAAMAAVGTGDPKVYGLANARQQALTDAREQLAASLRTEVKSELIQCGKNGSEITEERREFIVKQGLQNTRALEFWPPPPNTLDDCIYCLVVMEDPKAFYAEIAKSVGDPDYAMKAQMRAKEAEQQQSALK
jgi:hypothetical protein